VSHAHLYLYTEDGKLVHQLTEFDNGQDHAPLFSADGTQIVFTHVNETSDGKDVVEAASNAPASLEYWQVNTLGGSLKRLDSPPEWYKAAVNSPYFAFWKPDNWPQDQPFYGYAGKGWDNKGNPLPGILNKPPASYTSPDHRYQLVLRLGADDLDMNGPWNGKLYELKELQTGKTWKLGQLPDFMGLTNLQHLSSNPKELFLQQGPLNVAFFSVHEGSTFGEATVALDMTKPKMLLLPGNQVPIPLPKEDQTGDWGRMVQQRGNALPIPLTGESYFLAVSEKRYEPIPGSSHTANLSYLARFDASLRETPYVNAGSAPNFYGASLFRPGRTPVVMEVGEDIGNE
jgi:hypothetical protein